MRPVNGAVTRQYSRSSSASLMRALASSTAACDAPWSEVRWSTVLLGREFVAAGATARARVAFGQRHPRRRGLQLGLGLGELDFVGTRIDHEQQIALVDDLAVLEMDLGQDAADLGAQLDPVDRGELPEKAEPDIDIALQWLADRDRQRRRGRGRRRPAFAECDRPNIPAPPQSTPRRPSPHIFHAGRRRSAGPGVSFDGVPVGYLIHDRSISRR